jgi:hypothetical protein
MRYSKPISRSQTALQRPTPTNAAAISKPGWKTGYTACRGCAAVRQAFATVFRVVRPR